MLRDGDSGYAVYVTDNYENPDETIPADSLLDERVKKFRFSIEKNVFNASFESSFGETTGEGILFVVESLAVDPVHNRMLIAEELETESSLKSYTLEGTYAGEMIDSQYFPNQAEGIVLFRCDDGSGYWITTDQADQASTFHLFDRQTLSYAGSFRGEKTQNTDGIALNAASLWRI